MRRVSEHEIIENAGEANRKNEHVAFIIWTPLHLFNAIRYVLSRNLVGNCDLYYICQSQGMENYYQRALKENIFGKIFFTTIEKIRKNQHLWEISSVVLSPKTYIRHLFAEPTAANNRYTKIFISVPTRQNDAIIRANDCSEVVGYDDGTGSYIENLYERSLGKKYEMFISLQGKVAYKVSRVLLNNPEIKIGNSDGIQYEQLAGGTLLDRDLTILKRIFDYKSTENISRVIYLNQPLKEIHQTDCFKSMELDIVRVLNTVFGENISVRMHPREKDASVYQGLNILDNNSMWEMICNEEITDDNILISSFSTAQFTPKLIFDKEPIIVFTYKMFEEYLSEEIEKYEELVDKLRLSYRDKGKICVPKTLEELKMKMLNLSNEIVKPT